MVLIYISTITKRLKNVLRQFQICWEGGKKKEVGKVVIAGLREKKAVN